jgi:hypothetical protein
MSLLTGPSRISSIRSRLQPVMLARGREAASSFRSACNSSFQEVKLKGLRLKGDGVQRIPNVLVVPHALRCPSRLRHERLKNRSHRIVVSSRTQFHEELTEENDTHVASRQSTPDVIEATDLDLRIPERGTQRLFLSVGTTTVNASLAAHYKYVKVDRVDSLALRSCDRHLRLNRLTLDDGKARTEYSLRKRDPTVFARVVIAEHNKPLIAEHPMALYEHSPKLLRECTSFDVLNFGHLARCAGATCALAEIELLPDIKEIG